MPLGAIGALAGGALSLGNTLAGRSARRRALSRQRRQDRLLEERLNQSVDDVEGFSEEYTDTLDGLNHTFDPYELQKTYEELYEQVLVPLERDYKEYVDPTIDSLYSGGEYRQSGAYREAKARSARQLSRDKSSARSQQRELAATRAYASDERRQNIAKDRLAAQVRAPILRAGHALLIHQANSNTIAARLASNQQTIGDLGQLPLHIIQGAAAAPGVAKLF